ncbi:MAG: ATP-binding protein [Bacillota bacterium]|nr:ATP-binding protein [Bacillota bacterium]
MKTELETLQSDDSVELEEEVREKRKVPVQLGRLLANMKPTSIIRLYRLLSLLLSSTLFLLFPGNFDLLSQLSLILLLTASAILLISLYEHYWNNIKVVSFLIITEVVGISLLLTYTGGFHGPFLWYALNPFIVSTAFFSLAYALLILGVLIVGTIGWKYFLLGAFFTLSDILNNNYYAALNLTVIVIIMYMFARMHLNLSEQTMESKSQKRELLSAYQNLSENYQVFQSLSKFQREVATCKSQKDIYNALIETLVGLFPFRQAAVFITLVNEEIPDNNAVINIKIACSNSNIRGLQANVVRNELEDRWDELSHTGSKKMLIGRNRNFVAVSLKGEKNQVSALFVGWLKPMINPLSFSENLLLFIRFAEQTAEWLSMFKQRERVLQHISSIYAAVETVSRHNDPRMVIELFASYARALTGCAKAIFWMQNVGREEYDEYYPIFSVKGPKSLFPEEEWRQPLLESWDEVSQSKKPVIKPLINSPSNGARLISIPVKTGSHCFGMLAGIQLNNTYQTDETIHILNILADLSAIAVERARAEQFADKLLVIDEQKRIANEIHDTISQNLFSIVYSIDSLSKETDGMLEEKYHDTLVDIKNLSAQTARELRSLIYRLNPRQETNKEFIDEISSYLDKLARMNSIKIANTVNGSTEYLNPAICKVLYRIIREATGNALRHGKCSEVIVHLDITPFRSILKVSDNGRGFDVQSSLDLYSAGNRLGLVNMRELALSLQGSLDIKSKQGKGTEVTCSIPTSPVSVE